ncbi:MAG: hypothetical protein AAF586_04810 [Planctomycetota bacterium]
MPDPTRLAFSCAIVLAASIVGVALAQSPRPTVAFDDALNTWFSDTNGLMTFDRCRVAFAPEGNINMLVAVVDPQGQVVGQHPYSPDVPHTQRNGVFANVRADQGPLQTQLSEPGIYTIVWVIDGEPATRLPVMLRQTGAGDDPFNPQKTFAFDGLWRTHAYWEWHKTGNDYPTPKLHYWVGGLDVPEGRRDDMFVAELIRDGEVVAHSVRTRGHLPSGKWRYDNITLAHPHEPKDAANARPWTRDDLLGTDGKYEVRFTRQSDGQMIRSYDYVVADGQIVPLPETALDYEPRTDHILPRVQKRGGNTIEMIEATWIKDGGPGTAE